MGFLPKKKPKKKAVKKKTLEELEEEKAKLEEELAEEDNEEDEAEEEEAEEPTEEEVEVANKLLDEAEEVKEPKERFMVVKELPKQPVRTAKAEDGTKVNFVTTEEALTGFANNMDSMEDVFTDLMNGEL